jgi:HD-like signal output (HDOD) protein
VALCLPEPEDAAALLAEERARYGIGHDDLGARVLAAWHFPDHVCALISRHHEPLLPDAPALERSLHAGRLLADHLLCDRPLHSTQCAHLAWLTEGRLGELDLPGVLERISERSAALLDGLVPRRG